MRLLESMGPLRHRDFRRLVTAQGLSRFGSELALVSVAFAVLQISDSAGALGIVLMARTLPNVVFLLIGGVWADRLPRARVMVSSDLVCAAVQLGLAAVLLHGTSRLWLVVVLQALLGAASAFFSPAATGLTPHTVPEGELQRANSLLGLAANSAGMLGPAAAGVLVIWAGVGWAVIIDALTFLASACLLLPMRHRFGGTPKLGGRPDSVQGELAQGWHEVRSKPWVVAGIVQGLLFQACFAVFFTLGPVAARAELGGADAWGALVTAFGVGSVLGGLLALRIRPARPLLLMQVFLFAATPAMAAFSLTTSMPVLLPVTALAGAGFAAGDALWETALQRETPVDRLGRVAAFVQIGSSCLRPFGYVLAGGAAAAVGLDLTFRGASLLLAASVPAAVLLVPDIARFRNRPVGAESSGTTHEADVPVTAAPS